MSAVMPHDVGGEAWDQITLGGIRFSGLASVSGDAFKKRTDRRHAAGSDGARIVDRGFDLVDLTVTLVAWTAAQGEELLSVYRLVAPRSGATTQRRALDVEYPSLAFAGITQVYVTSATLPAPDGGKLTVTLKCTEYHEPPRTPRDVTTQARPAPQTQGQSDLDPRFEQTLRANPIPAPSASGASAPTPPRPRQST